MHNELLINRHNPYAVAAILSYKELVMNAGINLGVRLHQHYAILDHGYFPINDPDTDEIIGHLPLYKYELEVVAIEDKFSILSTLRLPSKKDFIYENRMRSLDGRENMNLESKSQAIMLNRHFTQNPVGIGDKLVQISAKKSSFID